MENNWNQYWFDFILKHEDKVHWNYISRNPNLTLEFIEKYPNKPWNWGRFGISSNRNLTLEWIEKYPNKHWEWKDIYNNSKLSLHDIEMLIEKNNSPSTKMTLEEFNKCEKDDEGNVTDPISFDNLTIDNAVMPPSASGNKSCFDRESIERWLNSNNTHPITREAIPEEWKNKYL